METNKELKISEKQKRFCEEYIKNKFNGTKAVIAAGYSEKAAKEVASRLLTKANINTYLRIMTEKIMSNNELTIDRIVKEWMKIAFSSIAHLHKTWVERKDFEELTEDQRDSIKSISTKVIKENRGSKVIPEIVEVEYVKIELYNKEKALEELGKFKGFYELDNKQKAIKIDLSGLSFEELLALKKEGKI